MVFPRISLKLTTQRMEMLTYFHGNNTILEWQFVSNNANMGFAYLNLVKFYFFEIVSPNSFAPAIGVKINFYIFCATSSQKIVKQST